MSKEEESRSAEMFDRDGKHYGSVNEHINRYGSKSKVYAIDETEKLEKEIKKQLNEAADKFKIDESDSPADDATQGLLLVTIKKDGTTDITSYGLEKQTALDMAFHVGHGISYDTVLDLCSAESYDVLAGAMNKLKDEFQAGVCSNVPKSDTPYLQKAFADRLYSMVDKTEEDIKSIREAYEK